MENNNKVDWSNPDPNRSYTPEELGIPTQQAALSKTSPTDKPVGINWDKPDPNRSYTPEELGIETHPSKPIIPTSSQKPSEDPEYEARVQKYMPEAEKVLAPKSTLDYVPGVKQTYAALNAGLGSVLPIGDGENFSERYNNMMAKQDAYRRAKDQDEEKRIQAQTPSIEKAYEKLSPVQRSSEAAATSFTNLPILGPIATKIGAAGAAAGLPIAGYEGDTTGTTFNERYLNNQAKKAAAERMLAEKNLLATVAGGIAQAPILPGSSAKPLGQVASVGAGYGLADAVGNGENPFVGVGIGTAGGAFGHGLAKGIGKVGELGRNAGEFARRVIAPYDEAAATTAAKRDYGNIYKKEFERAVKDKEGNVVDPNFLTPEMMANQKKVGQDVRGLDIGANALARRSRAEGVANPDFDSQLRSTLMERHGEQKDNMSRMFQSLYGKDMDPVVLMENSKNAARSTNNPNYKAVFSHPDAENVWNPRLQQLIKSPEVEGLLSEAKKNLEWKRIKEDRGPLPNPLFQENATASGETKPAIPTSLEFWDALKRAAQEKAYQPGAPFRYKEIGQEIKEALGPKYLGDLGRQYHDTLNTASKYFGQDDAFSAGQQLSRSTNSIKRGELLKGIKNYSPEEKSFLEQGFISGAMDKVLNSTAPTSVTKMLDAPNTKAVFDKVVDPGKAPQIEAFLRIQNMMNKAKQVIVNQSQTAANQADTGIGKSFISSDAAKKIGAIGAVGGAGEAYQYFTDNEEGMKGHLASAGLAALAYITSQRYSKFLGAKSSAMQKILLSNDPEAIKSAIDSIQFSPKELAALKRADQLTSRTPSVLESFIRTIGDNSKPVVAKTMGSSNALLRNTLSPSYTSEGESREQRKSGGSVSGKPRDLYKEIRKAMKEHKKNTEHTLQKHDNEIATSLQHATDQVNHADPIYN